jgi:hypothetical protein
MVNFSVTSAHADLFVNSMKHQPLIINNYFCFSKNYYTLTSLKHYERMNLFTKIDTSVTIFVSEAVRNVGAKLFRNFDKLAATSQTRFKIADDLRCCCEPVLKIGEPCDIVAKLSQNLEDLATSSQNCFEITGALRRCRKPVSKRSACDNPIRL